MNSPPTWTGSCAEIGHPTTTLDAVTQTPDLGGLFGGGDENALSGLLAQAQQMQEQLMSAQQEIAQTSLTGSAGNGLVTVTGTGAGGITGITIDPKVVDPADVETLQDLIIGALADLDSRRDALSAEKMGPLAGGLGGSLPGLH
ncbi:YbaB/EbfC family nucleoid-associated protein [Gordonia sp. X0973]|uniref:YbaB/EbfC family nucleoid-associated protein n=1 Tax=Gordonia sp. X0973 TaxID=2742602 RepID=UPI000F53C0C4|nr:YbaB/EbfC family nucleoid-associated protein [Gordonia sp. X0973]QKT05992.1 YbaB/EbfC family nucleoid-associated protein [Gordonia sp. X0973]